MACCAIAVFIISQIYLLVIGVRDFVFGKPARAAESRVAGAAAWRLDGPEMAPAAPSGFGPAFFGPRIPALMPLGLAGVAIFAAATHTQDIIAFVKYSANICGL